MNKVTRLHKPSPSSVKIMAAPEGLAACAMAMARLDEAVTNSPLQKIWVFQETIRAVSFIISSQTETPVSPDRLHASLAGLPLDGARDYGALRSALTLLADATEIWAPDHAGLFSDQSGDFRLWNDLDPITARGRREARLAPIIKKAQETLIPLLEERHGPILQELNAFWEGFTGPMRPGSVRLVAPLLYCHTGLTRTPLPTIAAALTAPLDSSRQGWLRLSLKRLTDHFERAHEDLMSLTAFHHQALEKIGTKPKNSKLRDAYLIAISLPMVTAPVLVSTLNCTRQAASKYLRELAHLDIVHELSIRDRWHVYTISKNRHLKRELATTPIEIPFSPAVETSNQFLKSKPPKPIDYTEIDKTLSSVIREVDAASSRVLQKSRQMASLAQPSDQDD